MLTEGVIPYLDEAAVRALAEDLHRQDNFQVWLAEYYSPELYPRYQSPEFKGRLGGAPFRFFPADWFAFFASCGWTPKETRYLHDVATEHHRPFPLPWWVALLRRLAGEERMLGCVRQYSAYILFEKTT